MGAGDGVTASAGRGAPGSAAPVRPEAARPADPAGLCILPVDGLPEMGPGDDLTAAFVGPLGELRWPDGSTGLADGDVVVVTSKLLSKVENRIVAAHDREDAITAETVRLVASVTRDGLTTRIVENRLGLVMAAAGVDASNTPDGTVLLLPRDPDDSARRLRAALQEATGRRLAVLLTDTVGRPWRLGLVDLSIGAAGIDVLDDLRGQHDTHGKLLQSTVAAVGDEIASAVELVTGKTSGRPVAVVRGLGGLVLEDDGPGAAGSNRASEHDLFRLGAAEAFAEGWRAAMAAVGQDLPVPPEAAAR